MDFSKDIIDAKGHGNYRSGLIIQVGVIFVRAVIKFDILENCFCLASHSSRVITFILKMSIQK